MDKSKGKDSVKILGVGGGCLERLGGFDELEGGLGGDGRRFFVFLWPFRCVDFLVGGRGGGGRGRLGIHSFMFWKDCLSFSGDTKSL